MSSEEAASRKAHSRERAGLKGAEFEGENEGEGVLTRLDKNLRLLLCLRV